MIRNKATFKFSSRMMLNARSRSSGILGGLFFYANCLMLLVFSGQLLAQSQYPINLTSQIEYLALHDKSLTALDLINEAEKVEFTPYQGKDLFVGKDAQANYWLCITIDPEALGVTSAATYYIQISNQPNLLALINYLEIDATGKARFVETGRTKPWHNRDIDSSRYTFAVDLKPGEVKKIYIQASNAGMGLPVSLPLNLFDEKSLNKSELDNAVTKWVLYGIMGAFLVYNFLMFAVLGNKIYLLYLAVIASQVLVAGGADGTLLENVWPENPQLDLQVGTLAGIAINLFRLPYIFLTLTYQRSTRLLMIYRGILGIGVAFFSIISVGYLLFGPQSIFLSMSQAYAMGCLVFDFFLIVLGLVKKDRAAFYLFFAEIWVMTGIAIFMMRLNGVLPHSHFTYWSLNIGYCFEIVLFSLAIASRMNQIQREKNIMKSVALKEEKRSNEVKSEFLNAISRELRMPMNGIFGNLDLIKHEDITSQQAPYLNGIEQSAGEMARMLDRILQYADSDEEKMTLQHDHFDLVELIELRDTTFGSLCQSKGIQLTINIAANVPRYVEGDESKLALVLDNLLDNAIMHTREGEISIDVSVSNHDRDISLVQFVISDTSEGITEAHLATIFDAFSSQDDSTAEEVGIGMGMGLAMCQRFVHLMQGAIKATATPGSGSQFEFTLPLTAREDLPQTQPTILNEDLLKSRATDECKVLIVEDNLVNQKVLMGIVKKLGYQTAVAENGQEALDILKKTPMDLVFMDCQMPVMDGYKATEEIRHSTQQWSRIPIVAVTANAMSEDKERCMTVGMNDFIKKPVSKDLIAKALRQYIA